MTTLMKVAISIPFFNRDMTILSSKESERQDTFKLSGKSEMLASMEAVMSIWLFNLNSGENSHCL